MVGQFMEDGSAGNLVLGLIGSGVSGLFLLAMGIFNGSAFVRAARAYRGAAPAAASTSPTSKRKDSWPGSSPNPCPGFGGRGTST